MVPDQAAAGESVIRCGHPSNIMEWYRIRKGRLQFRGRVTREPFAEWLKTSDGVATVQSRAAQLRIRFFARARAARRLWKDLRAVAATDGFRRVLQGESAHFAAAVSSLCYAPSLPRATVALRRIVVVPRAMIAGRAGSGVRLRLWNDTLAPLPEGVRAFFCEQILVEMDSAIHAVQPSVSDPVAMREEWCCVASDAEYVWVDPIWSGPRWTGHLFLYEAPREALSRSQRKEVERAVLALHEGLATLSRIQRQAIVRAAADGLTA